MQTIIYMLPSSNSYLVQLSKKDCKSSQPKKESETFYKNLLS